MAAKNISIRQVFLRDIEILQFDHWLRRDAASHPGKFDGHCPCSRASSKHLWHRTHSLVIALNYWQKRHNMRSAYHLVGLICLIIPAWRLNDLVSTELTVFAVFINSSLGKPVC